jgi:hypothetical protein
MKIQIKKIETRRWLSPSIEYGRKPVAIVIKNVIAGRFARTAATDVGFARSFHCSLRYRRVCARAIANMVVDLRWHCLGTNLDR